MNIRLRTSKNTDIKLNELSKSLKLPSKASIARIAIGLSLKEETDPRTDLNHIIADSNGFEFFRHTLTGNKDVLYKLMIVQHLGETITEDEYFPGLFNAHLERGINLLHAEYKMAGNRVKLIKYLLGVQ